jgi:hypothetical protein
MAMKKALGVELQTGVTASGLDGVHEQSATKSSAGEIKTYKDKDGKDISVYVVDGHKEYSFEAILEATVEDHEIGDVTEVAGIKGVVTKWDVQESNEDVKKVSVGIRTFPDIQEGENDDNGAGA